MKVGEMGDGVDKELGGEREGRPGDSTAGLGTEALGHSPCLLDVNALVGGAGGRRLGQRGRGEDALRPGVHGGLEWQRDKSCGRSVGEELRLRDRHAGWRCLCVASAEKALWLRKSHQWKVPIENTPNVTLQIK